MTQISTPMGAVDLERGVFLPQTGGEESFQGRCLELIRLLTDAGGVVSTTVLVSRLCPDARNGPRALREVVRRTRARCEVRPDLPTWLCTVHGTGYVLKARAQRAVRIQRPGFWEPELSFVRGHLAEHDVVELVGLPGMGAEPIARAWAAGAGAVWLDEPASPLPPLWATAQADLVEEQVHSGTKGVVVSTRVHGRDGWAAHYLKPLSEKRSGVLLERLMRARGRPVDVSEALLFEAGGWPFALELLADQLELMEPADVALDALSWEREGRPALGELLDRTLGTVHTDLKPFAYREPEAVVTRDLVRRGLIEPRSKALHPLVARWVRRHHPGSAPPVPETVEDHVIGVESCSDDLERADHLSAVGMAGYHSGDERLLLGVMDRILDGGPKTRARVARERCRIARSTGSLAEAQAQGELAFEIQPLAANACALSTISALRGDLEGAAQWAERGISIATTPPELAMAWFAKGHVLHELRDPEAIVAMEHAAGHFESCGEPMNVLIAKHTAALSVSHHEGPAAAIPLLEFLIEAASTQPAPPAFVGTITGNLALQKLMVGQMRQARREFLQALELLVDHTTYAGGFEAYLAVMDFAAGDARSAKDTVERLVASGVPRNRTLALQVRSLWTHEHVEAPDPTMARVLDSLSTSSNRV